MPITKSAKKALRQSLRRQKRNQARENKYRRLEKQARRLAASGKTDDAIALLPQVQQAIDKAVKVGVLKPNAGARAKSRLVKFIRAAAEKS